MSIGPIIDETQDQHVINNTACAKARQVLLVEWLVLGFCLTACYKSVLLSNMVNVGYEKAVDTVEDVLSSGKPLAVPQNTYIPSQIHKSSRASVRKLAEQIVFYNFTGTVPQWVHDGLVKRLLKKCGSLGGVTITFFRIMNKSLIAIDMRYPVASFSKQCYRSKEYLYSERTSFYLPKASPLKVIKIERSQLVELLTVNLLDISTTGHFGRTM